MTIDSKYRVPEQTPFAQPRIAFPIPPLTRYYFPMRAILILCLLVPTLVLAAAENPQVLRPGVYHSEEIEKFAASSDWIGLVKLENGDYVAKNVAVKMARVKDVVVDEGGEATAVEVTTDSAAEIFLHGLNLKDGQKLNSFEIKKESLKPGEALDWSLAGKTAKLSALGSATKNGEIESFRNYKWQFEWAGKKQILAESELLELQNFKLIWVGDLNEDGIPDIIADISNHENLSEVTVFLSQKNGKEPLKAVAKRMSTGC